jgi:hypothetical protein
LDQILDEGDLRPQDGKHLILVKMATVTAVFFSLQAVKSI